MLYGKKKKSLETIETDEDYYNLVKKSKTPNFTVIKESDVILQNFKLLIPEKINIPKNVHISDAVKICYYPNGYVNIYNDYHEEPRDFLLDSTLTFDDLLNTPSAPSIEITKEKINYVKALLKYLTPKGKEFFNNIFDSTLIKEKKIHQERRAERQKMNRESQRSS